MAFGDMRQDVKQDVFAGPIPANNAGHLAVLDLEGDIPEGPDGVVSKSAERSSARTSQDVAQGEVSLPLSDTVLLAQALCSNRNIIHVKAR